MPERHVVEVHKLAMRLCVCGAMAFGVWFWAENGTADQGTSNKLTILARVNSASSLKSTEPAKPRETAQMHPNVVTNGRIL